MAAKKSPTRSAAAALIAKATAAGVANLAIPAEARAEIEEILRHNDASPKPQRVPADDVIQMLESFGLRMGRQKFERMIRNEFGRAWGSQ